MEFDVTLQFHNVHTSKHTRYQASRCDQLLSEAAAAQNRISGHYLASDPIVNRATSLASSAAAVPALVIELQLTHVINA